MSPEAIWNSSTPNREELMIWTYNNGETPAGQKVGTHHVELTIDD
ncbi:MAG TPA: hypothetical protein V6C72_11135 [Chroococcales cyanobacterium]